MKRLKKLIKEEIKKLQEREYPIPDEILFMLRDRLKLNPLIRYVKNGIIHSVDRVENLED